nr:DNA topoisomerase 2-binding protein 1-like [Aedes albopictus]XP_029713991.1 DNA topoisomerase 2-binding protein 1-like [Aedes albopictus]
MSTSISEQQLVKLCFVLRDGKQVEDASEDMQMAYSSARDHSVEDLISWLDESECLRLRADQLTKKHVFVFEQFSGEAYENIRQSSAVLIGPRCLISCFLDNEAIPLGKYPVLTTAMRNLTVCSSGLKPDEKSEISRMVQHMGGYYLDILNAACTHLVAATVKSIKYEKAAEIKLKIMHPDWVKDVWEQSQQKMINATDSAFARHALPVFYSLTITSTGLSTQKRNQIKQLIEDNGGRYIGAFKSEITDILILEKNSVGSAKFQGAIRCKKECLSPAWIVDSVEAGYALPVGKYEIRGIKSSTPTKDDVGQLTVGEFNPDCTQLSMISHMNSRNLTINESMSSTVSQIGAKGAGRGSTAEIPAVPVKPSNADQKKKYREILTQISLAQAKKAGPFLDGCKIYLSGFASDDKEKLNKILNSGGATRFDELSDRISHIIVGEHVQADFREIREQKLTPHIMTLQWLVRSIELKAPAPEEDDLTFRPNLKDITEEDVPEPPSPASKKNLQSMNSTFKRPELPRKLVLDDPKPGPSRISRTEDDVLKQYMQKNASVQLPPVEPKKSTASNATSVPPPSGSTTQDSEMESQFTEFMFGKTLFIYGFSEEDATQIVSDCENCGGTIVDENYTDVVDYIVIPTCSVGEITFSVKGRETVNCIWLETSIQDGMCYPLEYYFEPILYGENDPKPLEDEVLVISTYSGAERNYLIALGGTLGAKVEDRLVRKTAPIVICKEASGAKYDAAIKWDLTVVNAEWLRECYKQKSRVNEQPFLVGASKSSPKNITEPPPAASTSTSRMSDLPEFSKNACLPTTSTDDVDIDSVFVPPAAPEPLATSTSTAGADPPKENQPGNYKYISVESGNKDTSDVEYAFKRLPSPELKKISYEERLVYSQELQEYGELIQSQLSQRKPFDPGHPVDTPPALKHRRLSALTGIHSPATPTSNNTSAGSSDYEQLSVTQRVMEFETPIRDTLYKVLKEAEEKERNLSPRTKKMNELLATPSVGNPGHVKTPSLPECMTKQVTPYGFRPDADQQNHLYHKRKLQVWDQFYQPKQQKDRRKSTPLSEIKRRFWKENLGEDYVNYMESKYSSTQFQPFQAEEDEQEGETQKPSSTAKEPEPECQPSTSKAGSSRGKAVFRAINDSNAANESAVVGEKRSRSDDDDDDDDDEAGAGDDNGNAGNVAASTSGTAADGEPVEPGKRANNVEDDQVKRLSELIAMNKNSAKKMKKFKEDTQYTEIPRFDSEMLDAPYAPAVGWCDPTEFDRERRFGSTSEAEMNRMIYQGTPVFALSGVNDDLRAELVRKIQRLKGEVSTKPNEYDPACTHILCSKPNRGEKILSGIAAGTWLLCTKYIDDSCKAGHFLNEEQYAWGNPEAKNLPPLEPADMQVATAAFNWRKKIELKGGKRDGVFTGFRVLLLAPKKQQFIRLLKSGGGLVIEQDPPFCDSEVAMMATHCFVDVKKSKIGPRDHIALAQAGIAVMNIMYLNAYLTSEMLPDPARYRLEI